MTNNSTKQINLIYTEYLPTEVKASYRKHFFNKDGNALYAVRVDPISKRYIRNKVRLQTDPDWYDRDAYLLYDNNNLENIAWANVSKLLINKIGLVEPDKISEVL